MSITPMETVSQESAASAGFPRPAGGSHRGSNRLDRIPVLKQHEAEADTS